MLQKAPIMNASGCWAATYDQLEELLKTELEAVVVKTCTLLLKKGNEEPTYYCESSEPTITFNSKGLPNYGYEYYKKFIVEHKTDKPLILSISSEKGFLSDILKDFNKSVSKTMMVEINASCPNAEGQNISYNLEKLKIMLYDINIHNYDKLILGLKLSPYIDFSLMKEVATIINDSTIEYVVLSNSIPIYDYKNVLTTETGGMSGKLNKYLSLSNVAFFSKYLRNKFIVGCGGIENENDVREYMNCGADCVQLGSCFYNEENNCLDYDKINNVCNLVNKI